ncbi:hypothetical protein RLOC_00009823 [Lonchura striata]|uniref:Uncharacterized protein n=1 Tax=Lonchura striata TaxID=40157 RepID=A0A218VCF6_9PASE|nr:hypothetical protein RLOC_00009823 [Lonchura striata domestica]
MGSSCPSLLICSSPLLQLFATLLHRQENKHLGLMGFLPRDIQIAVRRAAQKEQATRAGVLYFQCPICRDEEAFVVEMFMLGIRIPFSLGFSFTHALEKYGRKSRDNLYLREGMAAETHQLFLSPSDCQHGRMMMTLWI